MASIALLSAPLFIFALNAEPLPSPTFPHLRLLLSWALLRLPRFPQAIARSKIFGTSEEDENASTLGQAAGLWLPCTLGRRSPFQEAPPRCTRRAIVRGSEGSNEPRGNRRDRMRVSVWSGRSRSPSWRSLKIEPTHRIDTSKTS